MVSRTTVVSLRVPRVKVFLMPVQGHASGLTNMSRSLSTRACRARAEGYWRRGRRGKPASRSRQLTRNLVPM